MAVLAELHLYFYPSIHLIDVCFQHRGGFGLSSFQTTSPTLLIQLLFAFHSISPLIISTSSTWNIYIKSSSLSWLALGALWTPHALQPCWQAFSLPLCSISPLGALEVWCLSWYTPQSQSLIILDLMTFTPTSVSSGYHLPHPGTRALGFLLQDNR